MSLDQRLASLANACAHHLSAYEFGKYWQLATKTHEETVGDPSDKLDQKRLAQIKFLYDKGELSGFIRAWTDSTVAPHPDVSNAITQYNAFISIDLSNWDHDEATKEAIHNERDAFLHENDMYELFRFCFPRVCCIAGRAQRVTNGLPNPVGFGGTGFLVGPDLILTNYHVIEALLGDNSQARPNSHTEFAVFFDHIRKEYIRDHTKDVEGTVRVVPAKEWLVASSPKANGMADMEQTLDYALIRLAIPVGLAARNNLLGEARGWIKIPSAAKLDDPKKDARLVCPQHPGQLGRLFDFGRAIAKYKAASSRLAYSLNTSKGTSGSPLLSEKGDLIALHEADGKGAGPNDQLPSQHNRGILASTFADEVRRHLSKADTPAPVVTGLWAVRTRDDPSHPLIGRTTFLDWIKDQIGTDPKQPPVYVARGGTKTGKSFSIDILRTRLEATRDIVLPFAPVGDIAGQGNAPDRSGLLVFPGERPDALLAEVAKALGLNAAAIPRAPPELQMRPPEAGGGAITNLKLNEWASNDLTRWLHDEIESKPKLSGNSDRRLWIVLDIPPQTPFGPKMQSFLKSWINAAWMDRLFALFRWVFIDYDPAFVPPSRKVADDLVRRITEKEMEIFVGNAYRAVGWKDPGDRDLIGFKAALAFLDAWPEEDPQFWEVAVKAFKGFTKTLGGLREQSGHQ